MKWIGQHIYDLVARFRSDVYLEDIESGTIASGGNLGLDSNNKIVKQSDTGITDLHGAGVDGSNNQLLTDDGDGTVTSEANLTFDGSTLSIEADANTTANALFIDANSLTTGSAMFLDIDDATTTSATKSLMRVDYDKSGVTASSQSNHTTGLYVTMDDAATNDASGLVTHIGTRVAINAASNQGGITQIGSSISLTGGDPALSFGIQSVVQDGGIDFKAFSSQDTGDYFSIATSTHGATTLKTVDDDAANAHFEIEADGIIKLQAEEDYRFYNVSSGTVNNDDFLKLSIGANGDATLETVDAAAAAAHIELAADGDITLDAASQIKLEPGAGNNILLDGVLTVDGGTVVPVATAHDTAGTNVSIKSGATTAGTTNNIAGGALRFSGGQGKGTGAGGDITFSTSPPGSSGNLLNGYNLIPDVSISGSVPYSLVTIKGGTDAATGNSSTLKLENTTNNNKPTRVEFIKDKGAAGADGDSIGYVRFNADNAAQELTDFASIIGSVVTAADTDEAGKLDLTVAASNGTTSNLRNFINGAGHGTNDIVDVSIGYGAASTTTIAGTLTMGSTATLNNTGEIQVASQPNITTLAGVSAIGTAGTPITITSDTVTFSSPNLVDPTVIIRNETDDGNGPRLRLENKRGADGQDNDSCGFIQFYSYDDGTPTEQQYGNINVNIHDATNTEESGKMTLRVASHDGGLESGLVLTGGNVDEEVDVTIANGAASVTTIAGTLTMGSTATINNTGEIQVASQPSITTLAGLTSLGAAGSSTSILAGDLNMTNAVNDGNPTFKIGSSASNNFEIKVSYNSGAQTIDEVYFSTYTTSGTANDGRYIWEVDEVELARMLDSGLVVYGNCNLTDASAAFSCTNTTTSSATEGGKLRLNSNDGAAMAGGHRLGILTFEGAEDASSNLTVGAQIESFCESNWSSSLNSANLVFSTTDGNASTSTVLTLDSDKKATFTGPISCASRTLELTSTSTDGDHDGDVAYFGGTTSMTIGKIYHYNSSGNWELANADAVATADGLLAVALGSASDTHGMLLRGMVTLDHDPGEIGDVLYVQSDNAGTPGNATATAPSASGDCVRIIGYQVGHASAGLIWFNPDSTFVEVSA